MKPTIRGAIAFQFWLHIPHHFPDVELDEFIIMPNHIHGIIVITDKFIGAGKPRPTPPLRRRQPTLGQIVAYYKYQTTKIINQIDYTPKNRVWQRNYYDRIIRHQNSLRLIQKYIIANPIRWDKDPENPRRGVVSTPS